MATSAPPIPRIELAQVPTPLLKLERLSAELGLELWLKRDDFTDRQQDPQARVPGW